MKAIDIIKQKTFILLIFIALFSSFFIFILIHSRLMYEEQKIKIEDHTKILAIPVWNFDYSTVKEYLDVISDSYRYERIIITGDEEKLIFEVNGKKLTSTEQFLYIIKLIPKIKFESNIIYNKNKIAKITIFWYYTGIYLYFNIFIIIISIFIILLYYRRFIITNEQLVESMKIFYTVFQSNSAIMAMFSVSEERFTEINESFCKTFKYEKNEIIGKTVNEIHLFPDRKKMEKLKKLLNEQGFLRNYEIKALTKDKEELTILYSADIISIRRKPFILIVCNDITKKKEIEEELRIANKKLIETAHLAGKAEIATGVLHDIGNILNSVGISTTSIKENIQKSKLNDIKKLANLLIDNNENMDTFLASEKGKKIPAYIIALSEQNEYEKKNIFEKILKLETHIRHMAEVINLQQTISKAGGLKEIIKIDEIINDAIKISEEAIMRHNIIMNIQESELAPAFFDRHRILQILINLFSNAKYALEKTENKEIKITINKTVNDRLVISVADNGIGISKLNLTKIFNHGFTTRTNGHGFGLHSSANAAAEMGGTLKVKSNGIGKGSIFILEIPFSKTQFNNSNYNY